MAGTPTDLLSLDEVNVRIPGKLVTALAFLVVVIVFLPPAVADEANQVGPPPAPRAPSVANGPTLRLALREARPSDTESAEPSNQDGDPGSLGERSGNDSAPHRASGSGSDTDADRGTSDSIATNKGGGNGDREIESDAPADLKSTEQTETPDPAQNAVDDDTNSVSAAEAAPVVTPAPLDPHNRMVRNQVARCLQYYYRHNLNTGGVSSWSIMHAALAFDVDSLVHRDGPHGPLVNALGWLCWNGTCRGRRMMYLTQSAQSREPILGVMEGPGFQGHPGQFLAILAQCKVSRDFPLHVQGQELKVQNLIEREMATCRPDSELTFKLIALSHYLKSDAVWKDELGDTWTIPRLLQIELDSPLHGVACGGTHRLMGISYALYKRRMRGEPIDGEWARAEQRVNEYIQKTFWLQNRDGSFSSQWYQRRADWGEVDRKVQTTGHMLEWLVFSLPQDELGDPRVVRSIMFLANLMIQNRHYEWENGPRGHAIRALSLYMKRRFGVSIPQYADGLAQLPDHILR